jgi:hypothetical protein
VNPVLALRRLIGGGGELWLDESQCGYAGHWDSYRRSPDYRCQGFFRSFEKER